MLLSSVAIAEACGRRRRRRRGWSHSRYWRRYVKPEPKPKIVSLNPDHLWYDYSDQSIRWNTSAPANLPYIVRVDLDGEHDIFAMTTSGGVGGNYHYEYGYYADVGVARSIGGSGFIVKWATRIGELKIRQDTDGDYEWHTRDFYGEGEWFGFTLQKNTPPTDWVVVLHRSDGTNILPVDNTFWWSINGGKTWNSFTP